MPISGAILRTSRQIGQCHLTQGAKATFEVKPKFTPVTELKNAAAPSQASITADTLLRASGTKAMREFSPFAKGTWRA